MLGRRSLLAGIGAAAVLGQTTLSFGATSGSGPRLVVLNIRGGLDGLAAVIPYGDPYLAGLRGSLVPTGFTKISPFFGLHPSLPNFAAMVAAGEGAAVHAVGPIVWTRSHFEGQDYLQSGTGALLNSGWLNRVLSCFSSDSSTPAGLAVSAQTPLVIRGATQTGGWCTEPYAQMSTSLAQQIAAMNAADTLIGPATQLGVNERSSFDQILTAARLPTATSSTSLQTLAAAAGALLGAPNGPRIATLETSTVDTHSGQNDRLPAMLASIDGALGALKTSLGAAWAQTVVLTMTEFGRTAYANGTNGTDHGTGFAVLLAGGAVAGGKVVANWPGLASSQLYQQRDLAPTIDFRSVALGVLNGHLGISASQQQAIFPSSTGIIPLASLVRS